MAKQGASGITWTDETWNPVRGCSRISEGCRRCYAERLAGRFSGPTEAYGRVITVTTKKRVLERDFRNGDRELKQIETRQARWNGVIERADKAMLWPLTKKEPLRVFVNSMSDLFHENLPFPDIAAIFGVMAAAPQHSFQVLTKRPKVARDFFEWLAAEDKGDAVESTIGRTQAIFSALQWEAVNHPKGVSGPLHTKRCAEPVGPWPLPNVWIGVSVENQATADERIPLLMQIPAALRFLSMEPLLEAVSFGFDHEATTNRLGLLSCTDCRGWGVVRAQGYDDNGFSREQECSSCRGYGHRLDWCIVGGESGPGARRMEADWARAVKLQCEDAAIPWFFKQGSQANWPTFKDFESFPKELQVREFPASVEAKG